MVESIPASFQLTVITNDPEYWSTLEAAGCRRVMLDLEILGKEKRQYGYDTVISNHHIDDVARMRLYCPDSELVVRVNPLNYESKHEFESVLECEPTHIMLPMFREASDLELALELIDGRASLIPLVETIDALGAVSSLKELPNGVNELFFGLNDLHLEMGLPFLFHVLFDTRFIDALKHAKQLGRFGFGGVGPVNEGIISGRHVMAHHCLYGSSGAILARSFKNSVTGAAISSEINKLQSVFYELSADLEKASTLALESKICLTTRL